VSPGNTTTGAVLESIMKPTLEKNGYKCWMQQIIGISIKGRNHRVDVLVETSNGLVPVSVKWQQVSGTAEEKVPYEVIKLIHAIKASNGRFPYAYLVLAGTGWTMKDFYLKHGLRDYIRDYALVRLVSLEEFITLANRKAL
jgi:hypothetical protein